MAVLSNESFEEAPYIGARNGRNPRTVSWVLYRRAKFLKYTLTTSSSIDIAGDWHMVVIASKSVRYALCIIASWFPGLFTGCGPFEAVANPVRVSITNACCPDSAVSLLLQWNVLVLKCTWLASSIYLVESGDLDARGFLAFVTLLVTFSVWFRKM